MPEHLEGFVHRIARGDAALLGCPSGEAGHADSLGELIGLRVAGRISDVLGAPGIEVEAGWKIALGVGAFLDRVAGTADGTDGITLSRGACETFVPRFGGEERAARGGRVIIRQVDLRLHAFITDPERIASVGAEGLAVRKSGARERLRARIHGAIIITLERCQAGWEVDAAIGDKRDNLRRDEADGVGEVVD